ncbi:integrin alpha pat-2-like isoform X4 [Physella acuta]|uniref:integrin alpha pat-2-like isoform X4 n=1 Tax=Physella acuta TaxID=109671 RepID=UPI0027DEA7D2|nr:integrin alpha pat-2-like isoform X4 [Physella acuta]
MDTYELCCGSPTVRTARPWDRNPVGRSRVTDEQMNLDTTLKMGCKRQKVAQWIAPWRCVMLVLAVFVPRTLAFNVDLKTALVLEGAKNSFFGYAVAQHKDQSTNWVLIGAPRTHVPDLGARGVNNSGAVFRCKTDTNNCHRIPFDKDGNERKYNPIRRVDEQLEEKSDQWFGATLKSSGENGYIAACAPRYVYFTQSADKREPVGMCFLSKSSTTVFEKYSPCKIVADQSIIVDQYHRQGYCQVGFSAIFSHDGRKLLIGAPGSYYWQGQIFLYNDVGNKLGETKEKSTDNDYGYKGYASAVLEMDGDSSTSEYVVGVPKGESYLGKVDLIASNMTTIGFIAGEQLGSYFGSAIAVADLNGDWLDDIIVGAPLFADVKADAFDTGRVYIYYQSSDRKFLPSSPSNDILDGHSSQSRFGMALSGLSDINHDGYGDLCIGAPYAGEDKRGAIYIYHSSKRGIISEPSQIIYAKDLPSPLSAFGISISSGLDQDDNGYPDLLVGAYTSDKAVFFRSRPIVRVTASLKLDPVKIDLEQRSCRLSDSTVVTCMTIYYCIEYEGNGTPDMLRFDLSWVLDAKDNSSTSKEQRVFLINKNHQYTLQTPSVVVKKKKGQNGSPIESCATIFAYVKNEPDDKLSQIRVTFNFQLSEDLTSAASSNTLLPILDAYIPTMTSATAEIKKDCGDDDVCIPNLALSVVRVSNEHIIGTTATLEILVEVDNKGEDSFNTKLWIDLPPGVTYDKISNQRASVSISCAHNQSLVVCNLGNPLRKNAKSVFTLILIPTNTNETREQLIFSFHANSSNQELFENYKDNSAVVDIPVTASPDIALYGKPSPELIVLNTTEDKGEDKGRIVSHLFQLFNQGTSATNETELQILWPSFDYLGNPVLVMDRNLKIEGNGKCSIIIITPNNASLYPDWAGGSSADHREAEYVNRNRDSQQIACIRTYCTIIQCLVGYMSPRASFIITIQSKLNVRNFIERREDTQMYDITSKANARVRSIPYNFKTVDASRFEIKRLEVITKVNTDRLKPASKGVEMWIIAVAVTIGLLMLFLLILLLWWCGFFKRKKPEEEGYFVVNGKSSDIDNKIVD